MVTCAPKQRTFVRSPFSNDKSAYFNCQWGNDLLPRFLKIVENASTFPFRQWQDFPRPSRQCAAKLYRFKSLSKSLYRVIRYIILETKAATQANFKHQLIQRTLILINNPKLIGVRRTSNVIIRTVFPPRSFK